MKNYLKDKLSMAEQESLISLCETSDASLAALLKSRDLTYDNLRYRTYGEMPSGAYDYRPLDESVRIPRTKIPAISFFSGAGGLDIGFEYAGFNNLASVEHTELFCNTLRKNRPDSAVIGPPFYDGDISDRETLADILRREIGIKPGFEGVFHGGPPCQSFSIAANQRFGKNDERFKRLGFDDPDRGQLFFDYVWFIEEFLPAAFLIENVAGIQEIDHDGEIDKALARLALKGYSITTPTIVNAAEYGVPQNRQRWIAMGIRDRSAIPFPQPTAKEAVPCMVALEGVSTQMPNHLTRAHKAESVKRYMELEYGARDKLGRVDRLDPNLPSKTIIAGGVKGGGRSHLHPLSPRTLSVRESARLQGFPDRYVFTGSTARQFTQVGNAVPPLLAHNLAKAMYEALTKRS